MITLSHLLKGNLMTTYRCTRNAPYQQPGSGSSDPTARQGYFISAQDETQAIAQMADRFPHEITQGFSVTFWA